MDGSQTNAAVGLDLEGYGYRPKLVWNPGVHEYLSQAYGHSQFADICLALTRPCITSTLRVNTQQATTQEVMQRLHQHFHETSASNVGVVDGSHFRNAVKCVNHSDEHLVNDICWEHTVLKDVVMVRGHGPHEVDYRNERGEPLIKEVVVSRKCAEAVLRGANVFVPGLLACSLHVEKGDEVAVTVAVERPDSNGGWFVGITRGTTLASVHAKAQLEGAQRDNWCIGKGRVTMSRASLFKEKQGVAIEMTNRVFNLPPFQGLLKGQIFLQNLPSIVAANVLDPKPGERILDMCAAPGGKTTAIAILMRDEGEIIALDRSQHKVLGIKKLAEEMSLSCIQAYKMDATKAVRKTDIIEKEVKLPSQPLCHVNDPSGFMQMSSEIIMATQPDVQIHHSSKEDGKPRSFQHNSETVLIMQPLS